MAKLKTTPNNFSVSAFIDSIEPEWKRNDARELLNLMGRITGMEPVMWGDSIVGFGKYTYVYDSGRSGEWMLTGFSPRKQALTIYIMSGFKELQDLLAKLGNFRSSVSCLYIKRLSDVNMDVLEEIIVKSIQIIKKRYEAYN
jgi:hypothetical protein